KPPRLFPDLDRSGRSLTIGSSRDHSVTLLELPSGKFVGPSESVVHNMQRRSPEMPYWIAGTHREYSNQLPFVKRGEKDPVVVLGMDVRPSGVRHQFSATGTRYAWGCVDGTVMVVDFVEMQRRLAEHKLGW